MKTVLQFILLFFCAISMTAQSSVTLKINHLLSGSQFENEVNTTNDLGNDFMIDRLQYYLSGFSIVHDGGQVTEVEDLYVLVSLLESTDPTIIELGEYEIEALESIKFYFGVDNQANHADPSSWPSGHPLAPTFPSMHWGWAAGYRFIAIEGKSGPSINQELQFHCVGDQFYKELIIDVSMSGENSYTVALDAEYSNILSGIDISSGNIVHGAGNPMPALSNNIRDKVFTLSSVTSTADSELVNSFKVFPNPSNNGFISIRTDAVGTDNVVKIFDVMGRSVLTSSMNVDNIEILESGLYYVSLMDNRGKTLATRKVVVQ
ncbi:MAG: T9SS type A sorting domain-containing protein [Saprospiraceae bacterium]|nr:T9SS type A sorting domain-containing protein [Saprospiraceae bacterium]